jgi:hypothetical protein
MGRQPLNLASGTGGFDESGVYATKGAAAPSWSRTLMP